MDLVPDSIITLVTVNLLTGSSNLDNNCNILEVIARCSLMFEYDDLGLTSRYEHLDQRLWAPQSLHNEACLASIELRYFDTSKSRVEITHWMICERNSVAT